MNIIAIYRIKNSVLIMLKKETTSSSIDALSVEIDLSLGSINNSAWSTQKRLKFGYFNPVSENESEEIISLLDPLFIVELENLLMKPSVQALESLIK